MVNLTKGAELGSASGRLVVPGGQLGCWRRCMVAAAATVAIDSNDRSNSSRSKGIDVGWLRLVVLQVVARLSKMVPEWLVVAVLLVGQQ